MKEQVGYGGIIHNFKNYVIRGHSKYEPKIINQYQTLINHIKEYKTLGDISKEEAKLINNIQIVFTKYYNGVKEVKKAIQNGTSIKELDKVVKVNDGPAIKALNKLSKSLFSVPAEYWFEKITVKINLLKKIETILL